MNYLPRNRYCKWLIYFMWWFKISQQILYQQDLSKNDLVKYGLSHISGTGYQNRPYYDKKPYMFSIHVQHLHSWNFILWPYTTKSNTYDWTFWTTFWGLTGSSHSIFELKKRSESSVVLGFFRPFSVSLIPQPNILFLGESLIFDIIFFNFSSLNRSNLKKLFLY